MGNPADDISTGETESKKPGKSVVKKPAVAGAVTKKADSGKTKELTGLAKMWQFVRYDVPRELKKVAWPTPQDTATSTVVVIVLSVIFSIFFFIADRILQFLILGQLLGA